MSTPHKGPLGEFACEVEALAGAAVRDQVMAGSEALSGKSSKAERAIWMKGAIARLDELAPEQRIVIMERCGENCARVNSGLVKRAVARRQKLGGNEAFIAAELKKPAKGTRLERDGNDLIQYYTPQGYAPGLRCYCSLVKGLPAGETMSRTYCHCSKAFVRTFWEAVLGQPVAVELLKSAVSGASECAFRIIM